MGLLKKTGKSFLKLPVKAATIPFSLVATKGLRQNQRYFTDMVRSQGAILCPFCGQGRLLAVSELKDLDSNEIVEEEEFKAEEEEEKKPKGQLWQCNFCYNHIKTKNRKNAEVVSYINNNGREIYESGPAYQERQQRLQSGDLKELVSKRIKYSRLFFVLSGLVIIPFLYGAAKGALLYSLAILLFGVMLGLIGISNSYRAWQLYTDNVYSEDAKAQFHWWLKNRNWFISPNNPDYDKDVRGDTAALDEESSYDTYHFEEQYDEYEEYDEYTAPDGFEAEYPEYQIADFRLLAFYYVPAVYVEPQQSGKLDKKPVDSSDVLTTTP